MGLFGNKKSAPTVNTSMSPAKSAALVKGAGTPAIALQKVEQTGDPALVKKFQKAGVSLSKRDLAGVRAEAVLVLDHSGSMYSDYQSGKVQQLVERALGFALNIDADGKIPVIPFDSRVLPTVEVGLANYKDVVNRQIWRGRDMGTTDLAAAMKAVRKMAQASDSPLFCIVITDGEPDSRREAEQVVCDLASYPVFIKFLAIRPVSFLEKLDDLPDSSRLLDNVDAKFIDDPAGMSDLAFADAMTDEWDSWISLATKAGVLR